MIVLAEEERFGLRMTRAQDHEPQMMPDDELKSPPTAWAPCGSDRAVAWEDRLCADEEWSYDLFDLQDTGLVPGY